MSSRPYIVNRTANTEPTGQQLGDEWFNPVTNLLTKQVAVNGNAVAGAQVLLNVNNNVVTTGNITGGNISATGNTIASNFITAGTGGTLTGTGNIQAGNILTNGSVSATGTVATSLVTMTANTLAVTAATGTMEYDGTAPYFSIATSTRGVLPTQQIVVLTGNNTLTSQTAAQAIFDGGGGPANGAVTLPVGTYQYELSFALTGMSATSGSFGFAFGGTSTETFTYLATTSKGSNNLDTGQATFQTFGTAANTTLQPNTTSTSGIALIKGIIRVTVAGTLIPQVSLTQAAAAVVQTNSYFKISPLGTATVATVGNWS